jgi:hypothetical protein
VTHRAEVVELVVQVPDRAALRRWTLDATLPLVVRDGPPDLVRLTLEVDGRALVIGRE